jgi:hypothetical protein
MPIPHAHNGWQVPSFHEHMRSRQHDFQGKYQRKTCLIKYVANRDTVSSIPYVLYKQNRREVALVGLRTLVCLRHIILSSGKGEKPLELFSRPCLLDLLSNADVFSLDFWQSQSSLNLPPLQHITPVLASRYDICPRPTVGPYAETELHSPMEYTHTPAPIPVSNPFAEPQPMATGATGDYHMSGTAAEPYSDSLSGSVESISSANGLSGDRALTSNQADLSPMDAIFSGGDMSYDDFDLFASGMQDGDSDDSGSTLAIADLRFGSPFFHLSPGMQSLMEYYDRNICPYLVAFDGPANPYRKHILQLAMNNEGLQNAIAALATNNLRMRKKQPHRIGFVEEITDAFDSIDATRNSNDVSAEESMYKQLSIDQLNMQLTDVRAAQDDSVLATLLILCLFHVCDSGFSKFKTQLAGVQKLLSLRNPGVPSDFTGWVEMFFTWFDVMTSTVNDREMQIKGESLDMLDFSANLGALEQFSGCDGRLFKIIARLGRLNLLAQGRPVRSNSGKGPSSNTSAPHKRPFPKRKTANRSLAAEDYENIDGNGWCTPILLSDEDAEGSADEEVVRSKDEEPEERQAFWQEWNEVRKMLQDWQMDPGTTVSPSSSPSPDVLQSGGDPKQVDAGQRDLLHINESFRFSALLYTERLGSPLLPSSHPQFQSLVSQALYHITALPVTSCVNKFLLWPLFMTGTECVDEGHRNIIRTRCIEIQKESGFFNNLSGLEVLERVWREIGRNTMGHEDEEVKARRRDSETGRRVGRGRYGQAFRWRKAMDRVDGEYIVI